MELYHDQTSLCKLHTLNSADDDYYSAESVSSVNNSQDSLEPFEVMNNNALDNNANSQGGFEPLEVHNNSTTPLDRSRKTNADATVHSHHNVAQPQQRQQADKCLVDDCNLATGEIIDYESTDGNKTKSKNNMYKRPATMSTTAITTVNTTVNTTTIFLTLQQLRQQQTHFSGRMAILSSVEQPPMVMEMFNRLLSQLALLTGEVASLHSEIQEINAKIDGVNFDIQQHEQILDDSVEQHNVCATQVDLLTKVVVKQEQQMEQLKKQIDWIESNKVDKHLLFYGIEEEEDEDCKELIKNFFKLKLEIRDTEADNIKMLDAHQIGRGQN